MLVEAFVTESAVETLNEPVLLRLAQCDVMPQHRPLFLPSQDRVRDYLGTVATDDHQEKAANFCDPVKFATEPFA